MEPEVKPTQKADGKIIASTSLKQSIYDFVDGVAIRFNANHKPDEGGWGLVDEQEHELTGFKYWFIQRLDYDLYLVDVTPGLKKNVIRSDGKLIFAENFDSFYEYKNGYLIVGNTIRKTDDHPTRYLKGMLHVGGRTGLKIQYDDITWVNGSDERLIIKREGRVGYAIARLVDFTRVEFDVTMDELWHGTAYSICDGCIFSNGIDIEGHGCGKLFMESFRDRIFSGKCEYKKKKASEPSVYERRRMEYWREQMRKANPLKEHKDLLKKFVMEKLDWDIDKLKTLDLRTLKEDKDYDKLADAVCAVAMGDVFGKQLIDGHGRMMVRNMQIMHESFWGTRIDVKDDDYLMFHKYQFTEEQKQQVRECAKLCNTIGNLWFDPEYFITYKKDRFYFDRTLTNLCNALRDYKYEPRDKDVFLKKYIHGEYMRLLSDMMLDYFAGDGEVLQIFEAVPFNFNTTPASVYFGILEKYMEVCKDFIEWRSGEMVKKLRDALEM